MATRYWVGGPGNWDNLNTTHWASTSGGSGGSSIPSPEDDVIFDSLSGGGLVIIINDVSVKSITMGSFGGTLQNARCAIITQSFSLTGTGHKVLDMGSNDWYLSGNDMVIFDGTDQTYSHIINPGNFVCTYNGSNGTREIKGCNPSYTGSYHQDTNFKISNGTDSVKITQIVGSVDFTGFSGTYLNNYLYLDGNITFSNSMALAAGSKGISFYGVSDETYSIRTNGLVITFPFFVNNLDITVKLEDNLVMSGYGLVSVIEGTFDANNKDLTIGGMDCGNPNHKRSVKMGSGTWTLTGESTALGTGTEWYMKNTNSNLTLDCGTSTIKFTRDDFYLMQIYWGGFTYYNVGFNPGSCDGMYYMNDTSSNTFNQIKDVGTEAHTLLFPKNGTQTIGNFIVNGSSGKLVTIGTAGDWPTVGGVGPHYLVKSGGGKVEINYLNIYNSNVSPSNTWNAGTHSTKDTHTTGWYFTDNILQGQVKNVSSWGGAIKNTSTITNKTKNNSTWGEQTKN